MDREPSAAPTLTRGNITYFPVVPGRIEFAARVRRFLLEQRPGVIAVELPSSLESIYAKAIERMPQMSVILMNEDSDEDERPIYITVEPGDPLIEALRTARELEADMMFLEPPSRGRNRTIGLYPSTYSAGMISVDKYVDIYRLHPSQSTPYSQEHAQAMAWKLQGSDPLAQTCRRLDRHILLAVLERAGRNHLRRCRARCS